MSDIIVKKQSTPTLLPDVGEVSIYINSSNNNLETVDENGVVTTYSNPSNTMTPEAVQDIVGTMTVNSATVTATYNDPANTITYDVNATGIDHTQLQNVGTNTHAQIDTHIANTSNPHSVTKTQVGLGSVQNVDTTTTANIADYTNKRFVTDADIAKLGNTSGTNTGDQDLSGLVTKTTTVNGHALSTSISITKTDIGLGNVLNVDTTNPTNITQDATHRFVTDSEITSWNSKEAAITAGTTSQYFRGDKTFQTLDKTAVGLGNVTNVDATNPSNITQDLNHRFVTDTEKSTWNSKEGAITATTSADYYRGDKTFQPLNKAAVGLGNVDNTSDVNKPISTATQTALNAKVTSNTAITSATKTKITYDTKGLVTSGADANLDDLGDVVITSPVLGDVVKYNGTNWVNGSITTQTSAGSGVNYFLSATLSGITGYDLMSKSPDSAAEVDESISITSASGQALFESYISDVAIGYNKIDGGIWNFNIYNYVSAASGNTNMTLKVYSRTTGGIETQLFSVDLPTIPHTSVALQTLSTVQPSFTCNTTDKLVFKFFVQTTSGSSVTIHLVHSGNSHYTYIDTPLVTQHDDLAGLQGGTTAQYYHLTNSEYTGTGTGTFVRASGASLTSPNITTPTGITKSDVGLSNVPNIDATVASNITQDVTHRFVTDTEIANWDSKQAAITGAATTITTTNLTASKALTSDASGKVAASTVTSTELGYVSGVTSAIQTQLNGKEATITAGTTAQYWRGDKSFQTLDKTAVGLSNVDNTSDLSKPISTATQAALDAKAPLSSPTFTGTPAAPTAALNTNTTQIATTAFVTTAVSSKEPTILAGTTTQYWRGDKSWQTLDKTAVGLANVDNTSDANKPISTATQTALNAKEPTITSGTTTQYWRGDKTWQTLNSTSVGLGNVNNTADTAKTIAGDVSGTLGASTVDKIKGVSVAATTPTIGQVLTYNGTNWSPATPTSGGGGSSLTWSSNTVSNSTLALTSASNKGQIFLGTVGGQIVTLPDATSLTIGDTFYFINKSDPLVSLKDAAGTFQTFILPLKEIKAVVLDNTSIAGVWSIGTYGIDYGSFRLYDDFISASTTSNQIAALGWTITSGTVAYQTSAGNANGVIRVNSGTGNNTAGALNLGTTAQILLNNSITFCEQRISFPAIGGTAAAQLSYQGGLLNAATNVNPGTNPLNAIGFSYQGTTATAANIFAFSSNAATTTTLDTTVQVVAGTWYKATFIVNAAGTVAYFYLNNNYVGTINTNLPTAIVMAPMVKMNTGATNAAAKSVDVDYFDLQKLYTTVR